VTLTATESKRLIQAQIRAELEALGLHPSTIEKYLDDQLKELEGTP